MVDLEQFQGVHRSENFYKENLESARYQHALESYEKIKLELGQSRAPITLGILLDEQYETQVALKLLRVTSNSSPAEVPGIDQVFPPGMLISGERRSPLVIVIMGPPALGKTTLI